MASISTPRPPSPPTSGRQWSAFVDMPCGVRSQRTALDRAARPAHVPAEGPEAGWANAVSGQPVAAPRPQLVLSPRTLLERLARLVPAPRLHLTRYFGVLFERGPVAQAHRAETQEFRRDSALEAQRALARLCLRSDATGDRTDRSRPDGPQDSQAPRPARYRARARRRAPRTGRLLGHGGRPHSPTAMRRGPPTSSARPPDFAA